MQGAEEIIQGATKNSLGSRDTAKIIQGATKINFGSSEKKIMEQENEGPILKEVGSH